MIGNKCGALLVTACAGLSSYGAVPSAGLVGFWEADGSALDTSSTGNDGTFLGTYASGIRGMAFDLASAKVSVPNSPAYAFGSEFSIGFWFNNSNRGTGTAFVGQDIGGGEVAKWFIDYGYTGGHFEIHVNGPWRAFLPSSNTSSPADGWNHLALTVGAGAYQFYLNTVLIGSGEFSLPLPNPAVPLVFGYAEPGIQYDGLMDEIAIYNRTLSQLEVTQLAAGVPEPTTYALMLIGGFALSVTAARRKHLPSKFPRSGA